MLTLPAPMESVTETGDEEVHLFCCDDEVAICGARLADVEEVADETPVDCVDCLLLEDQPCPVCDDRIWLDESSGFVPGRSEP